MVLCLTRYSHTRFSFRVDRRRRRVTSHHAHVPPRSMTPDAPSSSSSIRTYLRLRPSSKTTAQRVSIVPLSSELDDGSPPREDNDKVFVECKADVERRQGGPRAFTHRFAFDGVMDERASQDEVFDVVGKGVVDAALDGYNATLFAYGQTGSGKTYTLTGGAARYDDRGIVPRALSRIFASIDRVCSKDSGEDAKFTVEVSYVEIYLERGYDLLATTLDARQSAARGYERSSEIPLPRVRVLEDEHGHMHVLDLTSHVVASEEEALDLLFVGDTNRAVAETPLNMASSRSHCIFTVTITKRSRGTDTVRRAKLNLVDLAGSERVNKSGVDGATLQEAKYINVSLHFLEQVIVALQARSDGLENTHVPYRNSLMTTMLRDSLGGNCVTVMVATASGDDDAFDESVSTCRFAQRVAKISNEIFVNEELDVDLLIARLKEENKRLRVELALLRQSLRGGDVCDDDDGDGDDPFVLSTDALNALHRDVERYVREDDYVLDCGANVAKIHAVQRALRDICRSRMRLGVDANSSNSATTFRAKDDVDDDEESAGETPPISSSQRAPRTPRADAFKAFCASTSNAAPALRARVSELKSLTANARALAREMNALKDQITRDREELEGSIMARASRDLRAGGASSAQAPDAERVLERAIALALDAHSSRKRTLDELRAHIDDAKRDIAQLKYALAREWREYSA